MGGLVGTLAMDLILMGALASVGDQPLTCFSIVGNTVARFLSIVGIEIAGGVHLGVATHYSVGPAVGTLFGALVAQVRALRVGTLKKCVILAVLFVEVLSQPLLAMTPLLLDMTAPETLEWFGGSFAMHFIWGIVLGVVVSYGLRLPNTTSL
jgi:hypothetical protein